MKPKLYLSAIIAIIIAAAVLPARIRADKTDPGPPQTVVLYSYQSDSELLIYISSSSPGAPRFVSYRSDLDNQDQLTPLATADAMLRGMGFRPTHVSDNQANRTYER